MSRLVSPTQSTGCPSVDDRPSVQVWRHFFTKVPACRTDEYGSSPGETGVTWTLPQDAVVQDTGGPGRPRVWVVSSSPVRDRIDTESEWEEGHGRLSSSQVNGPDCFPERKEW